MEKKLLIAGCSFAVIAVVLGALGAHALEKVLEPQQLKSFETGVRYQLFHAIALLIFSQVSILSDSTKSVIFYLFVIGVILFSFSIYGLSVSKWLNINLKFLGPVTPLGGLSLICGWLFALWKIIAHNSVNN
ncbi:hypothetical protein A9Q93_09610 [Nonlabens dokdonensis]|uniref:DUF423 domain-containing protein n=1 Tax=Nonlabens dokdonensis TaxID=328515 RepID=A0A1Z8AS39_9FLAO|nr:DUF423 domain-containing protein [Nonlabens dokdonensis]OUS12988.1 hypothetical protein A9Q93_09610 [Nonlabens dokdonensis]